MTVFRAFPVFTISYCIAYALVFRFGLQLFSYYPAIGVFSRTALPVAAAGTAINWYGWIATSVFIALLVSAIFLAVPRDWGARLWSGWSWIVPMLATLFLIYTVRIWFI